MKNLFWALMSATALICACSSISKKQTPEAFPFPPAGLERLPDSDPVAIDAQLERALRANPSEEMRFLVRFRQAKLWAVTDPAKSCALWLGVAENPRFPLMRVARLRAVETCPVNRTEVIPYTTALNENQDAWLQEASARALLKRARLSDDPALELASSLTVAGFEVVQADQLKLLVRAREIAEKRGDAAATERARLQLEKLAPRYLTSPAPEQFMPVAADFRRARDYEKARSYYRKAFDREEQDDFDRLRALDGLRMTYKLENQKQKYLIATREYSDFARKKFLKRRAPANALAKYLETRLTLARAVWTENSPREAEKILAQAQRELSGRYPVDEILFLRARIEEESGRLAPAVRLLESIRESRVADRATRLKIQWARAWSYRKAGRSSDAIALLRKLIADEEPTTIVTRNHFWLGRTYKDAGQTEQARAEFAWLIGNDPIGYYGMMAYRELGQPMPALGAPNPAALSPDDRVPAASADIAPPAATGESDPALPALAPADRLTFEWLLAATENELAKGLLDQLGVNRRAFTDAQTLAYLQLYARAGAYQSLFSRLSEIPPATRQQILDQNPELIFPRPWAQLVATAGARFDVKPQLVFSIIRQESSFNPTARSGADAFGLMQLLPEIAKEGAGPLDVNFLVPEDLYKPEVNITLGTAHLKELFRRWDDHFVPAVASYNASERAVKGWLQTRNRKDPLAFIEEIPYEETKGYVKLVMRNFVFYSRLTSQGQPVAFPEWCLDGIQDAKL